MDPESNPHFDERMGINKTKLLRPKKMSFQFVEEGRWSKEAEMMKLRVYYFAIFVLCVMTSLFWTFIYVSHMLIAEPIWRRKGKGY